MEAVGQVLWFHLILQWFQNAVVGCLRKVLDVVAAVAASSATEILWS